MEQVEQYLKTMAFKKRVVGGIDEENALLHIKKSVTCIKKNSRRSILRNRNSEKYRVI